MSQMGFPLDDATTETRTCSGCANIHCVQYDTRNLFFCSVLKGGDYGKKIKKSSLICSHYEKATEERIPRIDGHYGNRREGVKR